MENKEPELNEFLNSHLKKIKAISDLENSLHTAKNYNRVIPRDLFNESKLLKCIGRLCLLINDGFPICSMHYDFDGSPFQVVQNINGELHVKNINFFIKDLPLLFKTGLNSKENFPLMLEWEGVDYEVFDKAGQYQFGFITACKKINRYAKTK
jgi:hypothetical protein